MFQKPFFQLSKWKLLDQLTNDSLRPHTHTKIEKINKEIIKFYNLVHDRSFHAHLFISSSVILWSLRINSFTCRNNHWTMKGLLEINSIKTIANVYFNSNISVLYTFRAQVQVRYVPTKHAAAVGGTVFLWQWIKSLSRPAPPLCVLQIY